MQLPEVVQAPLALADELFRQHGGAGVGGDCGLRQTVEALCAASPDAPLLIPSLFDTPQHALPDNSLVRVRAMVQETLDPEYYVAAYAQGGELRSGRLRDEIHLRPGEHVDLDATLSQHPPGQRLPMYCVPIPGLAAWAQPQGGPAAPPPADMEMSETSDRKRPAGDDASEAGAPPAEVDGERPAARANTAAVPASADADVEMDGGAAGGAGGDAGDAGGAGALPAAVSATAGTCLIKFYDEDATELRVNELVEVIGVLAVGQSFSEADPDHPQPPASLVPRVHCITFRRLPALSFPLLPDVGSTAWHEQVAALAVGAESTRPMIMRTLTAMLGGDELAAEYLMLTLVSRVRARPSGTMAIGKFGLNLFNVPERCGQGVAAILGELVPKHMLVPLELGLLNGSQFAPRKNHAANRLESGLLQLPEGTVLTVDETALQPGQLNEQGLRNLQALSALIQTQKVSYDFEYHVLDFDADCPVVVLSQGKSMLPVPCRVPVRQGLAPPAQPAADWAANAAACRHYMALVRTLETPMNDEVAAVAQSDFVQARQQDASVSEDTFHHWLTMVRLVAISHGSAAVLPVHWSKMRALERSRLERLGVAAPAAGAPPASSSVAER